MYTVFVLFHSYARWSVARLSVTRLSLRLIVAAIKCRAMNCRRLSVARWSVMEPETSYPRTSLNHSQTLVAHLLLYYLGTPYSNRFKSSNYKSLIPIHYLWANFPFSFVRWSSSRPVTFTPGPIFGGLRLSFFHSIQGSKLNYLFLPGSNTLWTLAIQFLQGFIP